MTYKVIVIHLLLIIGAAFKTCLAQSNEPYQAVRMAVGNAFVKPAFNHRVCKPLRLTLTSLFIIFSKDSKVEEILLSGSPDCIGANREGLIRQIRVELEKLTFDRTYKNHCLVGIIVMASSERVADASSEIPENLDLIWKDIDPAKFKKKSVHFMTPLVIQLFPAIN
jgi:hypothetical protein